MTTFIYGGSNSLRTEGWTAVLKARLPEGSVVNRSIGAATSLMAMFRLLTNLDQGPKPGDAVIWEYALNEANHISRGYDLKVILRNVERFVRECAFRQLRLVPVILTPRNEEMAAERMPLYAELDRLFTHYGVAGFDLSRQWRAAKRVPRMVKTLYRDNAHYSDAPELYDFIVKGTMDALNAATVPRLAVILHKGSGGLEVQLFDEGVPYKNALIQVPVAPHRSTMSFDITARIIGVVALVHPDVRCALRLELAKDRHAGQWINISTTGIEAADKTILKVFSLENALGTGWEVCPGDSLDILPLRRPGPLYAESNVKPVLAGLDASQPPSFIGLVLERVE